MTDSMARGSGVEQRAGILPEFQPLHVPATGPRTAFQSARQREERGQRAREAEKQG